MAQSETALGVRVVVDMSTVEFIDSSGVSAVLMAVKRAKDAGVVLTVRNPAPRVRRVFEVLAIDAVLFIEGSR